MPRAADSTAKKMKITPAKKSTRAPYKGTFKKGSIMKTGVQYSRVKYVPSLGPLGLPKRLRGTFRYAADFTQVLAAQFNATTQFSANGMTICALTLGSGQPLYFDQIMGVLYNNYTVLSSKINVTLMSVPTNVITTHVGVQDGTSVANVISTVDRGNTMSFISNAQSPPRSVQNEYNGWNTYGGALVSDSELLGTASANPTDAQVYNVTTIAITNISESFIYHVVIDYYVEFEQLFSVALS